MMKKELKILWIILVIIAVIFAFLAKSFTRAQVSYDKVSLQNQLEEQLKKMIIENYSNYYKNIDISLEPKGITTENGIASAVFDTKIELTLKAQKVEDLPFIKGMLNYFNSRKMALSKLQIEEAYNLVNDWKLELKDYIDKPEPASYAIYKIVANIGDDGKIELNSVKLYASAGVSKNGDDFYPVSLPMFDSPEKMEKDGAKLMEETLNKSVDPIITNSTVQTTYTYNRLVARDYANKWTSNAPYNGDCYMDSSKWNNQQYPYYENAYCNDCADYVSQALHEGGIPIDPGQWERLKDGNGMYPWAWTSVYSLKNYMYTHGHWIPSNFTYANAGCIIRMPEYDYHTVMIVLNDTIHRQFSGHTNDRKQFEYYSSNGWEYYTVQ